MLYRLAVGLGRTQKQIILLLTDMLLIPVTLYLAQSIKAGTLWPAGSSLMFVLVLALIAGALSLALSLPRIKLNAYEQDGILRTVAYAIGVGTIGYLILEPLKTNEFSIPIAITFTLVLIVVMVSTRIAMRHVLIMILRNGERPTRVMIYGASQTGQQLLAALKTDVSVRPVCLVDDDPKLQHMTIAGIEVHSPNRIAELIKRHKVDRVILAMPSISRPRQARIAGALNGLGVEIRTISSLDGLFGGGNAMDRTRPFDPSEFLNRGRLERELDLIGDIYSGQSVMITGAGGSIGSELCRQIMQSNPSRLILFDVSETALYRINRELTEAYDPSPTIITARLGSVLDDLTVRRTINEFDVKIILHAAAYKHVNMVEVNELAGLKNNVLATKVLADAAREGGVEHFILVSTDKALRPTSVMGASKRMAELIVQDLASRADATQPCRFSMVRFGNVLGSSGSVVPLFEEQIRKGGPVTLTHAEVTRFFMTMGEAARLVLLAGSLAEGGEVFVLDMGSPVPIMRLARQMIESAGYKVRDADTPDGEIEIVITGLRPGEKLHEELWGEGDMVRTRHPKILRINERTLSEIEVATALRDIRQAVEKADTQAALSATRRWVDGYVPAKGRLADDPAAEYQRPST